MLAWLLIAAVPFLWEVAVQVLWEQLIFLSV